jgi:hypothetical protein
MASSISSGGSKKGAVSSSTNYNTQVAAIKLARQNEAKAATIKKTNDALKVTLKSDIASITTNNNEIAYVKAMVGALIWGSDAKRNKNIAWLATTTGTNTPGTIIIESDVPKLQSYIGMWVSAVAVTKPAIEKLKVTIAKNDKAIAALSKKTTPGSGTPKANPNATSTTFKPPPEFPDSTYQWNLPPHAWSLPVDPYDIAPDTTVKRTDNFHSTRRGRIWFYNGYVGPTYEAGVNTGTYAPAAGTGTGATAAPADQNKYGFQFIWNPETFSQSTSVNMSVTPSGSDPSIALTGFAAANSTMSFTLRLDRTNDFACAKGFSLGGKVDPVSGNVFGGTSASLDLPTTNKQADKFNYSLATTVAGTLGGSSFTKFYTQGQPRNSDADFQLNMAKKISELLTYGTESDLEYLYRTVNGDGWTGIGGRKTSNMGYLMPALIRVDLGNQKFVGVVSSVQVNHLAFTRDMVPIRTDVGITIDLRANIQPSITNGQTTL